MGNLIRYFQHKDKISQSHSQYSTVIYPVNQQLYSKAFFFVNDIESTALSNRIERRKCLNIILVQVSKYPHASAHPGSRVTCQMLSSVHYQFLVPKLQAAMCTCLIRAIAHSQPHD